MNQVLSNVLLRLNFVFPHTYSFKFVVALARKDPCNLSFYEDRLQNFKSRMTLKKVYTCTYILQEN